MSRTSFLLGLSSAVSFLVVGITLEKCSSAKELMNTNKQNSYYLQNKLSEKEQKKLINSFENKSNIEITQIMQKTVDSIKTDSVAKTAYFKGQQSILEKSAASLKTIKNIAVKNLKYIP